MASDEVTITTVAKEAGVSIKTVSRVINAEKGVSVKTIEKVKQVIARLNYYPSRAARQMASARSYSIALLYEPPASEFLNGVMEGMLPVCTDASYHILIEPFPKTGTQEYISRLIGQTQVDGMILIPPLSENRGLIKSIEAAGIKCVLIESTLEGVSKVGIDEVLAGREVAQHLLELGHRRIGYIALPEGREKGNLRLDGLRQEMMAADLTDKDIIVEQGDCSFESGYQAAKRMLQSQTPPTAIFAGNDQMAIGAIRLASELGLSVPEDISICGFDGTEISRMFLPSLTTVAQPLEGYGVLAAKMVLELINGSEQQVVNDQLPYKFLLGQSTENASSING